MVEVTVSVDTSVISNNISEDNLNKAISKGVEYAAEELIRVLMINSPVDHGLLKMWFIDDINDTEAHIKSPAAYAQAVNDGYEPYTIEPVSKKALYWPGADHPVKRVEHPGFAGLHFVENSIDDIEGRLDGYFLKALSEVLNK